MGGEGNIHRRKNEDAACLSTGAAKSRGMPSLSLLRVAISWRAYAERKLENTYPENDEKDGRAALAAHS